ncbi:BglG family transcription antiterminator [Lacrimispora indolis]|uniref:BglG family transcription antiterminator n=1 Tax=Lacrimispora indolis TaxID=69825 RepID=UPI0003FB4400|nr:MULTISPECIES: PTS sugar transporter subunit IIA [Lachnospiraceae]
MIIQRQIEILLELCKESDRFLTAAYFSKKMNVSLRTVQGDLKVIKEVLAKEGSASIISAVSKGTCLHIENHEEFTAFLNSLYQQQAHVSLAYPSNRVLQISIYLLNQHRSVSINTVADEFFISASTLHNDMKKLQELLEEFELDLLKNDNRILIFGSEINKRRYIVEKNVFLTHTPGGFGIDYVDEKQIPIIKNLLTEVLIKYKYSVADAEIQNAILFLNIMVKRLQKGFYISPSELNITDSLDVEEEIARDIFERLKKRYLINVTDYETNYFALYLKGKSNCQSTSMVTLEMDAFIRKAFLEIKNRFGIDFTDNINLRIALALHCVPLSIRLKYNMQLKSNMLDYIKQTFPLGYDIGIYFSLLLEERYGSKMSEAEISLIAVHFYSCLLEESYKTGIKQVLVISSLKNSMTLLLRQTLLKWFSGNISKLEFMNEVEVTDDTLDRFDVFLTTEKGRMYENGMAMFINIFPDNHDYMNIKLIMDGFKNVESILEIFSKDLFFVNNGRTKDEILKNLCEQANSKFGLEALYEEVIKREERGSTYFAEGIAVPHPMYAVSSDTFSAVSVVTEPLTWDGEQNQVHLVVMVCIGKNNPQAFQLWDYIARIFADKSFASRLLEKPDYETFVAIVKESLKDKIQ